MEVPLYAATNCLKEGWNKHIPNKSSTIDSDSKQELCGPVRTKKFLFHHKLLWTRAQFLRYSIIPCCYNPEWEVEWIMPFNVKTCPVV